MPSLAWLLPVLCLLAGCSSPLLQRYDGRMRPLLLQVESGQAQQAAEQMQDKAAGNSPLLQALEQGELQRQAGQFADSSRQWLQAVQLFRNYEEQGAQAWLDNSASLLINDKTRPYSGHDFERVLLHTRIALNHLAQGRWDEARIELRLAHEMEARIAARQEQQRSRLEQARGERPLADVSEIGGYPVHIIDAPEIRALKNSYQNALSHYLAAFVYEALGDSSLAAAGYRQALELQGRLPVLEQGLRDLDRRSRLRDGQSDVLLLVEADWAPAREAQNVTLPIPFRRADGYYGHRLLSVSFPTLHLPPATPPGGWQLNAQPLTLDLVTDTALLSRRALREEMPMIILRTTLRAASRLALSRSLDKRSYSEGQGGDLAAALLSGLIQVGGAIVEQADDRCWRTLPGRFYMARQRLAPGTHLLQLNGGQSLPLTIKPGARQQLLVLRWLQGRVQLVQHAVSPD